MNYYPPVGYYFLVNFLSAGAALPGSGGLSMSADASFKEVSGLSSDISVELYKEGGVWDFQHPLPSPPKHANITLKRGLLVKSTLSAWVQASVEEFKIVPQDILISLLGPNGIPIVAWHVMNAYPVKWEVSGFNAMENAIVVETIDLACRKHRRIPM